MSSESTPFVSVIIPVFRTATQLPRCLDSILIDRERESLEVVAVDDCSDDESWRVLQRYADAFPEVRTVRHPENRGLPYARQTGVEKSRGEYLLHLDSDDALSPGALFDMAQRARESDADIVQAPLQYATEQYAGEPLADIEFGHLVEVREGELSGDAVARSLGHYWSRKFLQYTITGKLYRRSLWEYVSPLLDDHPSLGEDVLFNVQLTAAAESASLLSRPGVIYIRRKGSYMEEQWQAPQFAALFDNGAWIEAYLHRINRSDLMIMKETYVRDIVVDLGTRRAKEAGDEDLIAYLQLMVRYRDLLAGGEADRALALLRDELKRRKLLRAVQPLIRIIRR